MNQEPKCPFCEKSISVWAVMKAPLPSAIRCPQCHKRIRVRGVAVYLTIYILLVLALGALLVTARRRNMISSGMLIVIAVAFLAFLELVTSLIVLRRARFEKPGP